VQAEKGRALPAQEVVLMPISIVMPAYNEERFLAEAIESVLAQTYRDFELIILDDGSRDRTLEIAQSYAQRDARIRLESHANMGPAPTLNRGLELSASEWVAVMHADDVMMPNRIERQLAFVAEHPELSVSSSWVKHIDSQGRVLAKDNSRLLTHEAVQDRYKANELIAFSHPAAILRKSSVQAVGGYRSQFRVNEDVDLWNRLLEHEYKILVQPEFLLQYRIHDGSASVAKARFCWRQVHWVKDCMLRRRRGDSELSWDEFVSRRKALPWYVRLNAERKDTAKVLYKAAVFQFARRKYIQVVPTVFAATVLQPSYTIRQIASKLLFYRS
jgi:glycosyltransferase involved in cell wall biosynthesis